MINQVCKELRNDLSLIGQTRATQAKTPTSSDHSMGNLIAAATLQPESFYSYCIPSYRCKVPNMIRRFAASRSIARPLAANTAPAGMS